MKLLIGDTEVSFSDSQLKSMYINEGDEAKVYKYGDEVLKVYKERCRKFRLTEEEAACLSNISTKRILLPKRILRMPETLGFTGYSTKFIQCCSADEISNLEMDKFLSELEFLEGDMELLADNKVEVADLHIDNMLFDGNIYFCDPGSFIFNSSSKIGKIYNNNIYELNDFVLDDLFRFIKSSEFGAYRKIYNYSKCLSSQIRKNTFSGETVKQHIKRLMR